MLAFILSLLSRAGRRVLFCAALLGAVLAALAIARRRGKAAGEAAFAIRRADARLRALTLSKETRHEVETASRDDVDRRLDRWMRD